MNRVMFMVFKNPYGFLIKHFKLIHLILTGLYIYLAIKVSSILGYYNRFILGTASKMDAMKYVTNFYMIAVVLSIIICLVIYALMRYKKKPRILYLLLIAIYLAVAWLIQRSYAGLDTIFISVLDTKTLLLYRDLLRILLCIQYLSIAFVLVRGLGFDIKKFNFVQDLEELEIDLSDEEEVELSLGSFHYLRRKIHRYFREFKYYYFENKMFLNIIAIVLIVFGIAFYVFHVEVVHKEYTENEVFSTDDFRFQVVGSYITNQSYDGSVITKTNSSFVVVKVSIASNNDKKVLNTSNLILKVNQHSYACKKNYSSSFTDLGIIYRGEKISGSQTYLFIYNVSIDDLDSKMSLVYAGDKTVYLSPILLDEAGKSVSYKLGDEVDLANSIFEMGTLMISAYDLQEKFSYPYEYEISGQLFTTNLIITSVQNAIMHLTMNSSYPYQLTNYSFLKQYATLKYKVSDKEYTSVVFDNKTPGNYKDGLYLAVDKQIMNASSVWLDIHIRNQHYLYNLK